MAEAESGTKIWIDLDNSPHVPFFLPIIRELEARGYEICLTARDCFQVCGLADLFGLKYSRIGRHYGRHRLMKAAGTIYRALQLLGTARREGPRLAISHGSRSQLMAARTVGIPVMVIVDYEHAKAVPGFRPTWVMAPEVIPDSAIRFGGGGILRYPGIKEDVYVPGFRPDPAMRANLGLKEDAILVTLRPPATEAHYHKPESDRLFEAVMDVIGRAKGLQVVLLPRNDRQGEEIRKSWPKLFADEVVVMPRRAIDGLNLIWHSDLVISGGGTMNREAAAMGVPVYSIFRGTIGAVDRYLSESGRLVLLESAADVQGKLMLQKRSRDSATGTNCQPALRAIVDQVVSLVQSAKGTGSLVAQ
jgi:hypothetical protein